MKFPDGVTQNVAAATEKSNVINCNNIWHTVASISGEGGTLFIIKEEGQGTGSSGLYFVSTDYEGGSTQRIVYDDRNDVGDDLQVQCVTTGYRACNLQVKVYDTEPGNAQCTTTTVVVRAIGKAGPTISWQW